MDMQKLGFIFVMVAGFVVAIFLVDVFHGRNIRSLHETEIKLLDGVEKVEPEDAARPPVDIGVDLDTDYDSLESSSNILTREELRLIYSGSDYTYTVREGDTIDDIARKYLGDNTLKKVLYEYNPELADGAELFAGREIVIPLAFRR